MSCFAAALALALSAQHAEPPQRTATEVRAMFGRLEPFRGIVWPGVHLQECRRHFNLNGYVVAQNCDWIVKSTMGLIAESLLNSDKHGLQRLVGGLHGSYRDLLHLSEEVAPELRVLGADMDVFRRDLRMVVAQSGEFWFQHLAPELGYPSFGDVPKGHWAAKAVSHLNAVGVVNGYPNRQFGG